MTWRETKDLEGFTIGKVGFKIQTAGRPSGAIDAMKLFDDKGSVIEEVNFHFGRDGGEWVFHDIPENKEIIGFECNIIRPRKITNPGLIVWTPNSMNM